jgi:hypothetical protein
MRATSVIGRAAGGLLAGLVGGLAMTLTMLALRSVVGVSPPIEMIPDRFAPTLTIDRFFELIGQFGGYNELKQFGVTSVLVGQLTVAGLLGVAYGLVAGPASTTGDGTRSRRTGDTAVRFLIVAVAVLWVVSLIVLWPTLRTGLGTSPAEPCW